MEKLYKPVIVKKVVNDEHYYYVDGKFYPSVTRILSETLPMPIALKMWLGDLGNEKAQQKLEAAASTGTAIHEACEKLMKGKEINLTIEFPEKRQKKMLVGFVNWFAKYQPKIIKGMHPELILASQHGYAGTLDLPVVINDKPYIVDIKTSKGIYDSHKLQLAAYRQAFGEMFHMDAEIAILHLNPLTKTGYSFYETDRLTIEDSPVLTEHFLTILETYKVLHGGKIPEPPKEDEYPEVLKLSLV
jgi:hypothetical protein